MAEAQQQQEQSDESTADEQTTHDILMDYLARRNVVLPKSCVLQAVERVLEPAGRPSAGKRAKIADCYRDQTLNMCADRSHVRLAHNRSAIMAKNDNSVFPIMHEMRHCLLTGDWDGYKRLVSVLFGSPRVEVRYTLSMIRSCFVLLFNHPNRSPQLVDDFIASCVKIQDPSKRVKYLKECFLLRGWTEAHRVGDLNDNQMADVEQDEKEEEEEMVFFSDCSGSD